VSSCPYLGSVINDDSSISEGITHNQCKQIAAGECGFESVSSCPYLGSVINDNSISEGITHRIKKGIEPNMDIKD